MLKHKNFHSPQPFLQNITDFLSHQSLYLLEISLLAAKQDKDRNYAGKKKKMKNAGEHLPKEVREALAKILAKRSKH